MITLTTSGTLKGKAGTATAITYTIHGDSVATGVDAFQVLGQGQLAGTTGDLLTTTPVPASTSYLIKEIQLANTTGSNVSGITFYVNGTASANIVWQGAIPANGSALYDDTGWHIYDSNGVVQSVGSTGPSGTIAVGTVTNIGTSGPPTVVNAGTSTAAVFNFGLQQGATGSTGAPGAVNSVTSTGGSIAVTGTTTTNVEVAAIPNATPAAGDILFTNIAAPATPAAGKTMQYVDSTSKNMASKNDAGVINHGVQTKAAVTHQFLTAINDDGSSVLAQPVVADVTGAAASARLINTTAPLTGGGDLTADRTLAISAASTSAAGSQSAAQFNTVQNLWFDVTNYGVSIGNSGAANTAAMNTLVSTTAGAGATFFFPQTGANYPFNGAILITKNDQKIKGMGQYSSVLFQTNTTDDLFRVSDAIQNFTVMDCGLWSSVTCSAGAAISAGTVSGQGLSQLCLSNVGFQGFGGTWFNCVVMNGTRGGEVALIEYCQVNSFTNWGFGLVGNTSTPATTSALSIDNTTMNGQITGTTGAVAGIYIQQSGAVNITNSDVISCTNNVLFAPITSVNQIVASVYTINSFLDHSHGSCLKFGGTQPIVRVKLTASSFTVSNDAGGNYSAIEFSNTATNPPGDIDILNCNIQNTFNNTATTNGILLTAASNVKIVGNNINGFTNNLQTSAAASSATKLNIVSNSFGPGTVTAPTSTNDVLLNTGTYGYIQVVGNVFAPTSPFQTTSTTHLNDLSTTAPGMKNISNNIGLLNAGSMGAFPTAMTAMTASTTTLVPGTLIQLPTSALRVGNILRFDLTMYKTTAAGTVAAQAIVKFGTAGTTADAAIANFTAGTSTALVDMANMTIFLQILSLGAAATCSAASLWTHSLDTAATGLGVMPVAPTSTATFNSTLAAPFIHIDITNGASIVMTAAGIVTVIA